MIALCLAFSETLGKSAQTAALSYNVEASNLWAFFQAKTIRQTVLRHGDRDAEDRSLGRRSRPTGDQGGAGKRIDNWEKTAARYNTERWTPVEGRKPPTAKAAAN